MHWKRGAWVAALLLAVGGMVWLFETPMTETAKIDTAPLAEQVLQACKKAPDARYLGEPEYVRDPPPPSETEVLRRGAIRVVWQGDNLRAYTTRSEHGAWADLPQLDYGGVCAVQEDRTGGLIAIGDQTSYRGTDGGAGTLRAARGISHALWAAMRPGFAILWRLPSSPSGLQPRAARRPDRRL